MICRITGDLVHVDDDTVELDINGLGYEVAIPPITAQRLQELDPGARVELFTRHFISIEGNRGTPCLMGFDSPLHRDFFEKLLEVSRFGPRNALRSIAIPIAQYTMAIELNDTRMLRSLPGVGAQRAKDIVASLQGKLGRFADVCELPPTPDGEGQQATGMLNEMEQDALNVLEMLGMAAHDVVTALLDLRKTMPQPESADDLIKEIFKK